MRHILGATLALSLMAQMAAADITGVWQTQPDRKDLTSHIEVTACGEGLYCGTVKRAFNPEGEEVQTPNIGKKLFWDVSSEGSGTYGGGEFWVPLLDVEAVPQMTLQGDTLKVKGCEHHLCGHQTWTRLQK